MRGKHRVREARDKGQREETVRGALRERKPQSCFLTIDESLCFVFLKPAGHDWRQLHSTCFSIAVGYFCCLKQNKTPKRASPP